MTDENERHALPTVAIWHCPVPVAAFLRARLDEDERSARAASGATWQLGVMFGTVIAVGNGKTVARDCVEALAEHIARHDPARVLRDVEAKRRIVDRYEDALVRLDDPEYSTPEARTQIREYEDFVLPALALPYAEHPDYRDEWRP